MKRLFLENPTPYILSITTLVLSSFINLLGYAHLVEIKKNIQLNSDREHEFSRMQHESILKLQDYCLKMAESKTISPIEASTPEIKSTLVKVSTETFWSSCLPYLPYVALGVATVLFIGIGFIYFGGAASGFNGGSSSPSVESTNIIGNSINTLNNTVEVVKNVTGVAADVSGGLKHLGETEIPGNTLEALGHASSVVNKVSQVAENVLGVVVDASSGLKYISKTDIPAHALDTISHLSSTSNKVSQIADNFAGVVVSGSEAAVVVSAAGSKAVIAITNGLENGFNNLGEAASAALTFKSASEVSEVSDINPCAHGNMFDGVASKVLTADYSDYILVKETGGSAVYYNKATSSTFFVEYIAEPPVASMLPPAGPILSADSPLLTTTAEELAKGAIMALDPGSKTAAELFGSLF